MGRAGRVARHLPWLAVSAAAAAALAHALGRGPRAEPLEPGWSLPSPAASFALAMPPGGAPRRIAWPGGSIDLPAAPAPDTILFPAGEPPIALRDGRRIGGGRGAPLSSRGVVSAFRARGSAPLPRPAARPLEPVRFEDRFMRREAGSGWTVLAGIWGIHGTPFPEQSVNPFSVEARFAPADGAPAPLPRGRPDPTGLGIVIPRAHVLRVLPGSPADRAGIREGDTVLAVDGRALNPWAPSATLLHGAPGTRATIRVARGAGPVEVTLTREPLQWLDVEEWIPLSAGRPASPALLAAGPALARDYTLAATAAAAPAAAGFGLAFDVQGPDAWSALRWVSAEGDEGRLEIVRAGPAGTETLASRPMRFVAGQPYRLGVRLAGTRISGEVDGRPLLEALDAGRGAGRFGLLAEGPGGCWFDDVEASSARASGPAPTRSLPPLFVDDPYMRAWSDPASDWGPPRDDGFRTHALSLLTDFRLLLPASPSPAEVRIGMGPAAAGFRAEPGRALAIEVFGSRARVEGEGGPEAALPPGPRPIAVRGLPDSALGRARVVSPQAIDERFDEAPWGFEARGGEWRMMNRWVCDPEWSWFGGSSASVASLWGTRPFGGDFAADVFVAPLNRGATDIGERPGDLNLTVLGDGVSLASGYCLILGGGENRWSRLTRSGRLLWGSTDARALLPGPEERDDAGKDLLHKAWFRVRLERAGAVLRGFLDDDRLFEAPDPEPLPDGRLAVWTRNNGILVSRVRIAAERIGDPVIPVRDAFESEGARVRRAASAGGDGADVERVRPESPISCPIGPASFDARQSPVVSFEASFRPGTGADLHLVCRGRRFRVRLAGPEAAPRGVEPLGAADGISEDGRMRPVRIDLGERLAALFRDGGQLSVSGLEIRAEGRRPYEDAGFTDAWRAAGYSIRRFRVSPRAAP